MSGDGENRDALQRFVSGVEVSADALAAAITDQALDLLVLDQSLRDGLVSGEAIVRLRTARRVGRLPEVGPAVLARMAYLAESDPDPRVCAAAGDGLERHAPPAPRRRRRWPLLAALRLELLGARGAGADVAFGPLVHSEAPEMGATLTIADGVRRLQFSALPERFVGTRPALLADGVELGRAESVVGDERTAAIALRPSAETPETVADRLAGAELVIYDD
jgi:hypothetical protein